MAERIPQTHRLPAGSPARIAAWSAISIGAAMGLLGVWLLVKDPRPPIPLGITFLVAGVIEAVTGWFSMRVVRVAWAFACSLNGTAAVVFLFGAPKVRDALELHIALALVPCLVFGAVTVLYALGSHDY